MSLTLTIHRLLSAQDAWSLPVRAVLRCGCPLYGAIVAWRNRRFDRGIGVEKTVAPVISVGNITTGGTGKTPLVIEVARRLQRRGRKVAVVARGYGAARGQTADEISLVSRRVPGTVCLVNPDRVAAARQAVADHGADVIVLDDGFQHRRLARDLDIVAIDATNPFGYGHLLPRGLLREPAHSLRRAGLIVVTRADQVDGDRLEGIHERLAELAPQAQRLTTRHAPDDWVRLDGTPAEGPSDRGAGVLATSGIGNPQTLERTLRSMDLTVLTHLTFADHHAYSAADVATIVNRARRVGADAIVTTEKDAVKLDGLGTAWPLEVFALQVRIVFQEGGETVLEQALDRAVVKTASTPIGEPHLAVPCTGFPPAR